MSFLVVYREIKPYIVKFKDYLNLEITTNPNHFMQKGVVVEAKSDKHAFLVFQNAINKTKIYEVLDINDCSFRAVWGN